MLEPASELTILVRVDNRRIDRLQTVTPDCEVDAGGLPVVWLEGVIPAQSAAWLTAQIKSTDAGGQREPNVVVRSALAALIWHPGDEPIGTIVAAGTRRPAVFRPEPGAVLAVAACRVSRRSAPSATPSTTIPKQK